MQARPEFLRIDTTTRCGKNLDGDLTPGVRNAVSFLGDQELDLVLRLRQTRTSSLATWTMERIHVGYAVWDRFGCHPGSRRALGVQGTPNYSPTNRLNNLTECINEATSTQRVQCN